MYETKGELPIIAFESQEVLKEWLEHNHGDSAGLWLKLAKKGSGINSVNYLEAVESALCYGWIDSQKASFDEAFWLQRLTLRKPRSKWSESNRNRAMELIEQGKMRPAGLREVELAQQDGRWEAAYNPLSSAIVPDDLKKKLAENPGAEEFFSKLDSKNHYAILYRIQDTKRSETRARRIDKYVVMLNEGKKLY